MTEPSNMPELARAADVLVRDYMAVRRNENVLITADTATDGFAVQAVLGCVETMGAKGAVLTIPQLPFQGMLADPYIPDTVAGAVMRCDVWIDLTFPYFAGSTVHDEAIKTGNVRYLLGGDMGSEAMARLFGKVDFDRYFEVHHRFDAVITGAEGKECRVTNGQGTDVRFIIRKSSYGKPRRADQPGMYLVPGACTIFPEKESVRGVIAVGSAFHEYYTSLPEPLVLQIDGRISEMSGGGSERSVMDRALRRAGGGEYGYVIHFTHGIHPAARQTGGSFIEDMRVMGANAVGLGLPWWEPDGGENHPDAIVSMQSLWVDNQQIVNDGALVSPVDLAELSAALQPLYQ